MHAPVLLSLLFLLLLPTFGLAEPDFFTYSDCASKCVMRNVSCTITEVQGDFPNVCINSAIACMTEASDFTTCIRPRQTGIGGRLIWPAFKARFHPTTTTTQAPEPSPHGDLDPWRIATIAETLFLVCVCISLMSYYVYIKRRDMTDYARISDNNSNSSHVISDLID